MIMRQGSVTIVSFTIISLWVALWVENILLYYSVLKQLLKAIKWRCSQTKPITSQDPKLTPFNPNQDMLSGSHHSLNQSC